VHCHDALEPDADNLLRAQARCAPPIRDEVRIAGVNMFLSAPRPRAIATCGGNKILVMLFTG
jgi:hypothetical protein